MSEFGTPEGAAGYKAKTEKDQDQAEKDAKTYVHPRPGQSKAEADIRKSNEKKVR